jgi:opacity protein-like surface antigen
MLPAFITALGAGEARAQETGRRRPLIEISGFTGTSATRPSDLRIVQPTLGTDVTFEDVHWRGRPFSGSVYYGYRLGTWLRRNPRLGFEIDFHHYKAYAKVEQNRRVVGTWKGEPVDEVAPMDDRVQEFRITNGVNALTFGVLYRFPLQVSEAFPEGRLQPYVGGGPNYSLLWPANQVDGRGNARRSGRFKIGGWGYTLQGGVRYAVTRNVGLFAEARYNRVDAHVDVIDGRADTDVRTWHGIGGFTVGF